MEKRNGALDVVRSLAILSVLNCHMYRSFAPTGEFTRAFGLGGRGVDLFYLLSGWLLGVILLRERKQTGTIRLSRFWLRRALRTLPAYYAVLLFTTVQQLANGRSFGLVDAVYWVFGQNYLHPMPYFGISWSLCVEEHFYLAVGPALLFMGRSRVVGGFVCVMLLVPTVCRLAGWYQSPEMFETHVRFDQCATGVALAWISIEMPRWWAFLTRYAIVFAGVGAIFAGYSIFIANIHWPYFYDACDLMLWTIIFATWILLSNSSPWFATALDFRFTHFLASRSYALYLLHIDAIAIGKRFNDLPLVLKMLLTWGIAFAAAEVLHRVVERPGIQAREWFRISRSRSRSGIQTQAEPILQG